MALTGVPAAHSGTLTVELLPLEPENNWVFLEDGRDRIDVTILSELENVGGVLTHVLEFEGGRFSESTQNLTNDENGLRTHKLLIIELADPDFPELGALFTPPIIWLTAEVAADQVIDSSGGVLLSAPGYPNISGTYSNRSVVVGFESVTVPLGTFEALRVDTTLTVTAGGQKETSFGSTWYVPGIGEIKETDDPTLELVSTNVPEPDRFALQLAVLVVLAALGFRSRGARAG